MCEKAMYIRSKLLKIEKIIPCLGGEVYAKERQEQKDRYMKQYRRYSTYARIEYRIGEVEESPEETPIWDGHKSNNKIEIMTWSNDDEETSIQIIPNNNSDSAAAVADLKGDQFRAITCPSCGQTIKLQDQNTGGIQDLPGLPAGVKFDPSDQEILQHLEAKVLSDARKLHPLIDEFITTIDGENGICYTHPEKLPGVNKDGQVRHFFHRPSKAYTTGTRKRRKVHTDEEGGETRWHKTGKTRPVSTPGGGGSIKGYKKILVLYTNYGRQRKPEKTNWVMHQYHLGEHEEEKEGELVVSKVFYQTQPRQCGIKDQTAVVHDHHHVVNINNNIINNNNNIAGKSRLSGFMEYYNAQYNVPPYIQQNVNRNQGSPQQLIQNVVVQRDEPSFNIHLPSSESKGK